MSTTKADVSRETFRRLVVQRIEAMKLGAKYRVKRFRVRRYNGKGKRQGKAA
jgi:hypothetical protein